MAAKVVKLKSYGLSDRAVDKLQSSGLTAEDAQALGMYSVDNAAILDNQFEAQPALVIPYFNPTDGKPMRAHPAWPDFYRLRYVGEQKHDFAEAAGAKANRYSQPSNTGVCAYFPSLTDWRAISVDPAEPVLITEGELKAAKSCREGFPCIGLGGVYNFRQSNQGIFFLPELEAVNWVRRRVTIVYDSDYKEKPQICSAINRLAQELGERGASVYVATLEDVYEDDRKTGIDDLLVERGDDGLLKALEQAEPLGMTRRLWEMNEEIVYVRNPGMIVVQKDGTKIDCSKFTAHSDWATQSVPERKVRADGTVSVEKAAAAPIWLKWPLRRAADKLSYLPGDPAFTERKGVSIYNQWREWGATPRKGDVKPWLDLIKFIFAGAEKEAVEWFLDWAAYPIQFPGTKLFSAVIIHGRMTGTGKTLIGYSLARIYGDNFIKIKSENLHDTWWAENRQFVLGDEISGSDKRSEADAMKAMITQEEININIKYIPQFSIPDCVNYYLTSNHCDALFLEDEDRRLFVHEVVCDAPLPLSFYQNYDKWLKEGGPDYLMHWLMQRDLSKFNPKGPAFRTAARDRMILVGKGDLDLWCRELRDDPQSKLHVGQMRHVRDLFSSAELLEMYERQNERAVGKVTANGMSRALNKAGFRQAYRDQPILNKVTGRQARYFIIRNKERWDKVKDGKEFSRHVSLQPMRD